MMRNGNRQPRDEEGDKEAAGGAGGGVVGGEAEARRGCAQPCAPARCHDGRPWVHCGTGMNLGTGPQPRGAPGSGRRSSWHRVPWLATLLGSPSPSRAGTGDPAPPTPLTALGEEQVGHRGCPRGSPGTHRVGRGAWQPPQKAGREQHVPPPPRGQWGPSLPISHGCRAAAAAPTRELQRASWRWEMAPCHHGNGATGLPCQGDTPSRGDMRAEPRGAQHPMSQALGTMSWALATGSRRPWGHATEPITRPGPAWSPGGRRHVVGCHPDPMPPQPDATPARWCHPGASPPQPGSSAPPHRCWARGARAGCSPSSRLMMRIVKVII